MNKLLFVFSCAVIFSSCTPLVIDDSTEQPSSYAINDSIVTPTTSKSVSITSSNRSCIVDSSVENVTISGDIAGKTVYYAVVNTLPKDISSEYVRYIANGNGSARTTAQEITHLEECAEAEDENIPHCHHGYDFHPAFEANSSKAIAEENYNANVITNYSVGRTSKQIYTAISENSYVLKKATLWATNEACNVWVLDDDNFVRTEYDKRRIASSYAEKFSSIYPLIRNVFGNESDYIYSSIYGSKSDMANASETGRKVNIVIYDLFNDRYYGDTVGFFSSMDYYKNALQFTNTTINRSNEGKYFYIDSYFATRRFGTTISTLAHEFQHMINFSVKTMNGLSCDQNFNEMLSMLCEDMMQEYLNLSYEDSPKARLKNFISNYCKTGIRGYDNTAQSYANAYAFGAWLARNYGGAAFVKEMMTNGKSNNACITAAVNSMSGKSLSFNEIFAQFVSSCFNDESCSSNKDAAQNIFYSGNGGYNYPMTGINLWDILRTQIYALLSLSANCRTNSVGPVIFENATVSKISSSYGMMLKSYGEVPAGTTSLNLKFDSTSGKTNSGILIYVYVK